MDPAAQDKRKIVDLMALLPKKAPTRSQKEQSTPCADTSWDFFTSIDDSDDDFEDEPNEYNVEDPHRPYIKEAITAVVEEPQETFANNEGKCDDEDLQGMRKNLSWSSSVTSMTAASGSQEDALHGRRESLVKTDETIFGSQKDSTPTCRKFLLQKQHEVITFPIAIPEGPEDDSISSHDSSDLKSSENNLSKVERYLLGLISQSFGIPMSSSWNRLCLLGIVGGSVALLSSGSSSTSANSSQGSFLQAASSVKSLSVLAAVLNVVGSALYAHASHGEDGSRGESQSDSTNDLPISPSSQSSKHFLEENEEEIVLNYTEFATI